MNSKAKDNNIDMWCNSTRGPRVHFPDRIHVATIPDRGDFTVDGFQGSGKCAVYNRPCNWIIIIF